MERVERWRRVVPSGKVMDLTSEKRVHLSDVLLKIPEKTYSNSREVMTALEAVV